MKNLLKNPFIFSILLTILIMIPITYFIVQYANKISNTDPNKVELEVTENRLKCFDFNAIGSSFSDSVIGNYYSEKKIDTTITLCDVEITNISFMYYMGKCAEIRFNVSNDTLFNKLLDARFGLSETQTYTYGIGDTETKIIDINWDNYYTVDYSSKHGYAYICIDYVRDLDLTKINIQAEEARAYAKLRKLAEEQFEKEYEEEQKAFDKLEAQKELAKEKELERREQERKIYEKMANECNL